MENPFAEEPKPTSAWLWQVFTGVGLVILLGLHFIANHFVAKGGLRDFTRSSRLPAKSGHSVSGGAFSSVCHYPCASWASARLFLTLDSPRSRNAV